MTGSASDGGGHGHGHTIALTQAEQGAHAHQYSVSSYDSSKGAHMHKKHPGAGSNQTDAFSQNSATPTTTNGGHSHTIGGGIQDAPSHTHPASVSGADHSHGLQIQASGGHGHTVQQSGEEARNKNLPPYFALWYIIRII